MAVVAGGLYLIATKHVSQESSYGFQEILGILAVIGGAFVTGYVIEMRDKKKNGDDTKKAP